MVTFECCSNVYTLSDEIATLLAQNLRNYANGTLARDDEMVSRLGGNPAWIDGALAVADFTEELLVENLTGPLPLEGMAAEAVFWALRLMDQPAADGIALRDALGETLGLHQAAP
jgi:hypothetical protein